MRDTEKETQGACERDGEIRDKMAKLSNEWGLLKGVRGEAQVREADRRKEIQRGKGSSHQTIRIHCLHWFILIVQLERIIPSTATCCAPQQCLWCSLAVTDGAPGGCCDERAFQCWAASLK